MRKAITSVEINEFLIELGRQLRKPVRLVLTGGASMLLRGLRGQTQDIDIAYSVPSGGDGGVMEIIRDLKEQLKMSIEIAEPGQFIPIPRGRENRYSYVDRFGSMDVFLDDPYSIALSKLDRGQEKDLYDIVKLVTGGFVDMAKLEERAREIAAPETKNSERVDLKRLLARVEVVQRFVAEATHPPEPPPPS